MSQENVEVVKACYDLFANGDLQGMLQYFDPEGEIVEPRQIPGAQSFQGHEGLLAAIEHWAGEFEDFRADSERMVDAGDSVIALTRQRARGKQSGAPVEITVANVYTFRNGLITRWEMFATLKEALEAVGLREEDLKPAE